MTGKAAFELGINKAGVVIVNYNSAQMAIEAALSALGAVSLKKRTQVIIIDNASPDESYQEMKAILAGQIAPPLCSALPEVIYEKIENIQVVYGKHQNGDVYFENQSDVKNADILLIAADKNHGFGAGCNIGISILKGLDTELFIMLNPDAVMTAKAIHSFAVTLDIDGDLGLVGASILEIDAPHYAQLWGGAVFMPFTLLGRNIGEGQLLSNAPEQDVVDLELSYPHGAAMACRLDYIEHAGLFDERYFLYYEEADWVAKGSSMFRPGWVKEAIVYHHRGAVTGSHLKKGTRSALADYHMARSRLIYAYKWMPWLLPVIFCLSILQIFRRFLRGQRKQAYALLAGILGQKLPEG